MKYNEWRDELKNNLLCVSESERRRVLDYYAEAYADRRDAGYSEREIIDEFGAPYDAAQRILSDDSYDLGDVKFERSREDKRREERELREERRREERERREDRRREEQERREELRREERERRERERRDGAYAGDYYYDYNRHAAPPPPQPAQGNDYTWVFVLLCVVFAIPIFGVVMGMVAVTVGFCIAPFALLISGVAMLGAGIGGLFADAANGFIAIGTGLMLFGLSLVLMPLCFKLVKWMWKLFAMFFAWLRRTLSGRRN